MAGHKGHKPGKASKEYKIRGTYKDGGTRARNAARKQQDELNHRARTRYCVGCGRERKPRSGPFCPDCSSTNTERGK